MSITSIPALTSWMGSLSDDLRISQLSIPGTHDSCAVHDGGLFGFVHCQTETIEWQLNNGIRYLDIRCKNVALHYDDEAPGVFGIYHGVIYQQTVFSKVLDTCIDFLSRHPKETILMRVQQESSTDDDLYKSIFATYLERYQRNKFFLDSSMPTLGVVRGKIVLLTGAPYIGEGLGYGSQAIQDDFSNPQVADKEKKISDHMNNSASSSGWTLHINHLSANGAGYSLWTPWSYAQVMNPYTLAKIQDEFRDTVQLGVIVYDYAGASTPRWDTHDNILAKAIIARNNFLPPPAAGAVHSRRFCSTSY